jgi:predicted nucleotidyltransferase
MPTRTAGLTPYSDVNAVLQELLTAVQPILGRQFIGLYLYGSLAASDFHPNRSDIDFVVVTAVLESEQ